MSIVSSNAFASMVAAPLRPQASATNAAELAAPGPLSAAAAANGARAGIAAASLSPAILFDRSAPHADRFGTMVTSPNLDLAGEILEHLMASTTFAAVARVIRADPKMIKALLDINA